MNLMSLLYISDSTKSLFNDIDTHIDNYDDTMIEQKCLDAIYADIVFHNSNSEEFLYKCFKSVYTKYINNEYKHKDYKSFEELVTFVNNFKYPYKPYSYQFGKSLYRAPGYFQFSKTLDKSLSQIRDFSTNYGFIRAVIKNKNKLPLRFIANLGFILLMAAGYHRSSRGIEDKGNFDKAISIFENIIFFNNRFENDCPILFSSSLPKIEYNKWFKKALSFHDKDDKTKCKLMIVYTEWCCYFINNFDDLYTGIKSEFLDPYRHKTRLEKIVHKVDGYFINLNLFCRAFSKSELLDEDNPSLIN